MDYLSKHNGLIDCAKKAVRLKHSSDEELEYVAENLVTDKATSNRIVLSHLDATSTMEITISPLMAWSLKKWCRMPMCLVLECSQGL
jgi:hypothetical protein